MLERLFRLFQLVFWYCQTSPPQLKSRGRPVHWRTPGRLQNPCNGFCIRFPLWMYLLLLKIICGRNTQWYGFSVAYRVNVICTKASKNRPWTRIISTYIHYRFHSLLIRCKPIKFSGLSHTRNSFYSWKMSCLNMFGILLKPNCCISLAKFFVGGIRCTSAVLIIFPTSQAWPYQVAFYSRFSS